MTYRGLTWDHPRGRHALEAAARRVNSKRDAPLITWDVQPLEGFESAPIADLAAQYDVLVLDHPHIGEAVATGCLLPLSRVFRSATLAAWATQTIGPAFRSYQMAGALWALPLDVATQVMALSEAGPAQPPRSWEAVEQRAAEGGVAQSLAGPHAYLTLISMVAGQGGTVGGDRSLDPVLGAAMLERMHRLYALRPPGSEHLNPIGLLEAMARGEGIAMVPLVFGYVNYARPDDGRAAVRFHDTIRSEQGLGGVLGGTGIALTARCVPSDDLCAHLAHLMTPEVQSGFIPDNDGQPSARTSWHDPAVNAAWGGFYAQTAATAQAALLRPRFDGYVAFQTAAAASIRKGLAQGLAPSVTLAEIDTLWAAARDAARPPMAQAKEPT